MPRPTCARGTRDWRSLRSWLRATTRAAIRQRVSARTSSIDRTRCPFALPLPLAFALLAGSGCTRLLELTRRERMAGVPPADAVAAGVVRLIWRRHTLCRTSRTACRSVTATSTPTSSTIPTATARWNSTPAGTTIGLATRCSSCWSSRWSIPATGSATQTAPRAHGRGRVRMRRRAGCRPLRRLQTVPDRIDVERRQGVDDPGHQPLCVGGQVMGGRPGDQHSEREHNTAAASAPVAPNTTTGARPRAFPRWASGQRGREQ